MALKAFPENEAWDTSVAFTLEYPNQQIIETPARTSVYNFGIGRWAGRIEIGLMGNNADARKVEAFFDSLRGATNEFEIAMRRDADIDGDPTIRTVSTTTVSGVRQITLTAGTTGFKAGDMIRIGNRAYRLLTDINNAAQIRVEPNAAPSNGVIVNYKEAKMRVRLRDGNLTNFATPYFVGPWSLNVIEAL